MERLEELREKFPEVPRSIVIKTDVLREGVRFTPDILEIGKWALPEYLPWDPDVHKQYKNLTDDLVGDCWAWLPMKFNFANGVSTKIVYDFIRRTDSPYEIRRQQPETFFLYRDGEPIEEIFFDKRPEWLSRRSPDGRPFAAVFCLASPDSLLGFPIKFCAYYKPEDICRFCCLNPAGVNLPQKLKKETLIDAPRYAEAYEAALEEFDVQHICFTGGALRDRSKEAGRYVEVVSEVDRIRRKTGKNTIVQAMSVALGRDEQQRIRDAGADEISFNMEVWEESLWSEIVPGKARDVGRGPWMERLLVAREVFGARRACTQFVVGVEMVSPRGFRSFHEGTRSVLEGIEWCCQNGIRPHTTTWFNTPGSLYEENQPPPTEYFLTIAFERHKLMEKYGMHPAADDATSSYGRCHKSGYLSPDADFHWLEVVERRASPASSSPRVLSSVPHS